MCMCVYVQVWISALASISATPTPSPKHIDIKHGNLSMGVTPYQTSQTKQGLSIFCALTINRPCNEVFSKMVWVSIKMIKNNILQRCSNSKRK